MTSPDLVSRFDTIHALKTLEDQEVALKQMSYEELSNQIILFGEAKKGQKFGEIVMKDPAYCRSFLKKWGTSPKAEHRMFTYFLNLWVERKELTLGIDPEAPGSSVVDSSVCPKAKAKAKSGGKSSMPPLPIDLELDEEEGWDRMSQNPVPSKEDENAKRLDQLEGVLSEVIVQMKALSQHLSVSQGNN